MDGMIRTVGDGRKAVQIMQMTRDGERCGNPWSPTSAEARHCDEISYRIGKMLLAYR